MPPDPMNPFQRYTLVCVALLFVFLGCACTSRKTALQRATDDGYMLGTSDSIKRQYWLKQALEKKKNGAESTTKTYYYTFDGPTETKDGRKLVDHKVTVPVKE
jgi:hypothetical protein